MEQIVCNICSMCQFHKIDREMEQTVCNISFPCTFTKLIGRWNKLFAIYVLCVNFTKLIGKWNKLSAKLPMYNRKSRPSGENNNGSMNYSLISLHTHQEHSTTDCVCQIICNQKVPVNQLHDQISPSNKYLLFTDEII